MNNKSLVIVVKSEDFRAETLQEYCILQSYKKNVIS